MSNYLSKSYQVQAPADYSSTEVGAKVAYAMQGKYDQNKAIIDQTLASYNSQLKGLRDTDNEYISAKLKEVKSAIDLNSQKNGDLSKSYNKDSILSAITSVMDDPIIQDAVISAQNGKNLDNQYQELLKKDPKLANTGNYQDAKDLGGYSDYMAGKSKVLGKMELTPYTDVVGELHKRAKEYAKDYGLQERYLGSDQTNPYYYEDKYGKVLTKTEVYNFLNSTLTVPERKQLQIDTRQSLGKTDEATYSKFAKNYYNDEITSSQSELAQLKAKRDTAADKTGYNKLIAEVDDKIKDYKTKSASSQIDKGDMYDIYNKTTLNNISSSYDIDIITKIDRDHLPLDIMKFQSDVAFHKEDLRLKQEANDLKKKENQISQQIAGGTPIVKETPPEESEDSDMTKIRRETARTATALDMYLTEHIEEYKDMSESEKWDYKLHYNPSDLTVKGNTSTAKVLANEFQTAQKGFANIVDDADNKIKSQVKNSFNDLSGGSANIDNLKNTMPLTASIIKGKKGIQFESLSEPIKKGLVAEWAANKLQYSSPSDEDVRNMYAKVIIKNKVALQKVGGGESNYVLNTIKESSDIEKVRNPFSSALEASARVFKNVVIDPFTEANADIGRRLFFGESYANEKEKEYLQTQHQDWKTINKVGNEFGRGITDYFNPSQDTNITELEARDLAVRKGKTSTDVSEAFHNLDGSLNKSIQKNAENYQPNIKEMKAFNFSTGINAQKAIAQKIRAVVLNEGEAAIPAQSNDYTVSREGESTRISYLDTDGKKASIVVGKIDPTILSTIDNRKANWLNDPKNPNIILESVDFKPIENTDSSVNKINSFWSNIKDSGVMPIGVIQDMLKNPSNTPFASTQDYVNRVKSTYGKNFYDQHKTEIDKILSTNYVAKPYSDGATINAQIGYYDDNKVFQSTVIPLQMTEKNDVQMYIEYMNGIAQLRMLRIKELK